MDWNDRFKLYERLYFNELDRREKLSARLSLPFAAMVAVIGLLSYMLNSGKHLPGGLTAQIFWLTFAASSIFLLVGAWFFRKAWYGSTDQSIPTASVLEERHSLLLENNSTQPEQKELTRDQFSKEVFDYFVQTSSVNNANNNYRTNSIYRANVSLTIAILLAFISVIPFYLATNHQSESMSRPIPPPPPPPPPPPVQYVKDGHPKPPPAPKPQRR